MPSIKLFLLVRRIRPALCIALPRGRTALAAKTLALAGCLATLAFSGASRAGDADPLWDLLDSGKPAQAYTQARDTLPPDHAERDLIMGVAAAGEGRGSEAAPLLRRHLESHPGHPQNPRARLELGRAYLQTGQLDAAQAEFDAVLAEEPPEPVVQNIRLAQAAIAKEREGQRPQFSGYVDAGVGFDSNINAGVKSAVVNLPVFGEIELNQGSTEIDSAVAALAAGVDLQYAVRRDLSLFGSARLDGRFHPKHGDYDQFGYTASGGVGKALGQNVVRGSLLWNGMQLDYHTYRNLMSATVDWGRNLDQQTQVGAYGQVGDIDYTGNNSLRNARTFGAGLSFARALEGEMKPVLRLSASMTRESNQRNRDDLGRNVIGARAGLEVTPAQDWSLSAGLTFQRASHRGVDTFLSTRRKDDYTALDLSAGRQINPQWSARAEFQYAENDSNLALYEYQRTALMFHLRRDFR